MSFFRSLFLTTAILLVPFSQTMAVAQRPLPRPNPRPEGESKPAYALTVVMPPQVNSTGDSVMDFRAMGITDNGTIFAYTGDGSLRKRLPGGEIVPVVEVGKTVPGGGKCHRIVSVTVGVNGDLVVDMILVGSPAAPSHPEKKGAVRRGTEFFTLGMRDQRRWLYYFPRDTKERTTFLEDAVPITAWDEMAPGGAGWIDEWKNGVQIAGDGTVLIGAIVVAPPAQFDAYYVFHPAAKDQKARLAGPIVMSVYEPKPAYKEKESGFFGLGAPSMDEAGNIFFPAEPVSPNPAFVPIYDLYRLPRTDWETAIAASDEAKFPLPAPTRLLGVSDLEPVLSRWTRIDGAIAPSVDRLGTNIIVRTKTENEAFPRFHEAILKPSGGTPTIRTIAGGFTPGPDNSQWNYLGSQIVRGNDGILFLSGRTQRGPYRGDCLWAWRSGEGFSSVVRPDMPINGDTIVSCDLPHTRMTNRAGTFVFTYSIRTKTDKTAYGIATAKPL